ncbi:MAG: protein translocase subunit SecDF [Saprospiraceae bacterium]|nr:protein translocase subunit SecDF [Saprospiraceae bacterium]
MTKNNNSGTSNYSMAKWVFGAIIVVSLFQFLLYLPTNKVEKRADTYAQEMSASFTDELTKQNAYKEARTKYLDSLSTTKIFSIPLLKDYTYTDLKKQQLGLGLDLKGGYSVIMQVNLEEFITALAGNSKDPDFVAARQAATNAQANSQKDYVTLFAEEYKKRNNGRSLASLFSRSNSLKDKINTQTPDDVVIKTMRELANETVNTTFERVKDRIDKFGVTQPNVSLDKNRDMILVELPGVDNPARARKYIQAAAKLEFWDVYRISDPGIYEGFINLDKKYKGLTSGDTSAIAEKKFRTQPRYEFKRDSLGNPTDSTLVGMDTIPEALDPLADKGPILSLLTLNGATGQGLNFDGAIMGSVDKSNKEKLLKMLDSSVANGIFPNDIKFLASAKPYEDNATKELTNNYEIYAIKKRSGTDAAPLDGERVSKADASPDNISGKVAVSLAMDAKGAKIWGDMTTRAAQDNNRNIAIALDNEVVSAPTVNEPILGGNSSISGNFSIDEAEDLANILQVGKLPATPKIISESLVGPSLGQQNIKNSLYAIIGGFLLVMIFMIWYYAGAGVFSIVALLLNIIFILATLASLGTVLTLPGIAGLVLTMGISVDANVIIYERIKEELALGRSKLEAISNGFSHSMSAILDANITNLLTCFVLFYYGLGAIKGFAIVLIIGILFALFLAIIITRVMLEWWIGRGNDIHFSNSFTAKAFKNINFDWVGTRKYAYIFSGILTIIGLISALTRGFELGVEFKGGYSYNVAFDKEVDVEKLRNSLTKSFESNPIVKSVDTKNTFNITTSYLINDNSGGAVDRVTERLFEGIKEATGEDINIENFKNSSSSGIHISSSSQIGPIIADDIKSSAIKSLLIALLIISIYIYFRFHKWQYSAGTTVALLHDAFVVIGVFSLFHGILPFAMEIDQAFIAAILTIIGYSMNDTIIVYDRIKEYLRSDSQKEEKELINDAINTTLSRTINVSFATILTMITLFIFGGASIKGFAFAMIVGIIIGTYSSIYVATPIIVDFAKGSLKDKIKGVTKSKVSTKVVKV